MDNHRLFLTLHDIENIAIYGFGSAQQRRYIWYTLYGITNTRLLSTLPKLKSYHPQILLDVHRSFHYDHCLVWTNKTRHKKLEYLSYVLQSVFPNDINGPPYYVQGIHDIASILLLSTGDDTGSIDLLQSLVSVQLLGYVQPDMKVTLALLYLIEQILGKVDPVLLHHIQHPEGIEQVDNDDPSAFPPPPPIFALPWLLTWFSHSTDRLNIIIRLFDIFIIHHPFVPLYIVVALLLAFRTNILHVSSSELYLVLQNLPLYISMKKYMRNNNDIIEIIPKEKKLLGPNKKPTISSSTTTKKQQHQGFTSPIFHRNNNTIQQEISLQNLITLARLLYYYVPPQQLLNILLDSKSSSSTAYQHYQTLYERWPDIFYWDIYFPSSSRNFGLSLEKYQEKMVSMQVRDKDENNQPNTIPNIYIDINQCLSTIPLTSKTNIITNHRLFMYHDSRILRFIMLLKYRIYYRLPAPSIALQKIIQLRKYAKWDIKHMINISGNSNFHSNSIVPSSSLNSIMYIIGSVLVILGCIIGGYYLYYNIMSSGGKGEEEL